jgi:multiple sugar transport system ATP-binding protein
MGSVRFEEVSKYYGKVEAVVEASWTCSEGEVLSIVGPSGCGKSTSLRLIAGLEDAQAGRMWIGDRVVNRLPPRERRVGFAFETYALFPTLTAYENIAFPLKAQGSSRSEIERSVREVASVLEIEDVLNRRPLRLSGGQQQRVGLARALVSRPEVMLLDEPISHLDPQHRSRARTFLKEWQQELGVTMIYVTHDQEEALALADQVLVMNEARLQHLGSPDDVYSRPANLFVAGFIGEPPMNFLDMNVVADEGSYYLQDDALRLPLAGRPPKAEGVVVGVRPHALQISREPSGVGSMEGKVHSLQRLGDQAIVTVDTGTSFLLVLTEPSGLPEVGTLVWLRIDQAEMHLFDARTGQRLEREGGRPDEGGPDEGIR